MKRILVLPEHLANQIAAGEVVERPAAVVKELIENSIDAGASRIAVRLEAGGKSLIAVEDDGHGLAPDDLALALERHATSKIATAEDLAAIHTLGFRGEALPSIASVSRFTMTTLGEGEREGAMIRIEAGRNLGITPAAFTRGTAVEVADLFYNVPARLKFLKSTAAETQAAAAIVTRIALAHPEVHFHLTIGGKLRYSCPKAASHRERVSQLFDDTRASRLLEVRRDEPPFKLTALIDPPTSHYATRVEQYLFINRRPVVDRGIQYAIARAYDGLVPGGRFPGVFLFLEVDPATVDVNVHPAKSEVRFVDPRAAHSLVQSALREALSRSSFIPALPRQDGEHEQRVREAVQGFFARAGDGLAPPTRSYSLGGGSPTSPVKREPDATAAAFDPCASAPAPMLEGALRVLGQFRRTFIIAVDESGLLLADQHTAHERVLFEELGRRKGEPTAVQPLLIPQLIEIAPARAAALAESLDDLNALGVDLEPMGGSSFSIRALPAGVSLGRARELVEGCIEALREGEGKSGLERRQHRLRATVACHSAVTVNMTLDNHKMEWILRELLNCDEPLRCPHGRATLLRFDEEQVKRGFGRYW